MNARRYLRALVCSASVCTVVGCAGGSKLGRTPVVDQIARLQQADAYYATGQAEAAAQLYLEVLEDTPDEAELWVRLGNAYVRAERSVQAARAYEQAVSRDPSNAQAWFNLGVVLTRQAQDAYGRSAELAGVDHAIGSEGQRMQQALSEALAPPHPPQDEQELSP